MVFIKYKHRVLSARPTAVVKVAFCISFAGCAIGGVASALAMQDPDVAEPETEQVDGGLLSQLNELDAKLAAVKDLSADFEQRRFTPLLKKPLTSQGTVLAISGQSLWQTSEPYESSMRIGKDRLELYYPEQKIMEVYPIQQRLGELASSPMPRLAVWRERFHIAKGSADDLSDDLKLSLRMDDKSNASVLILALTPKDGELAESISRVLVVIDLESGLSRAMAWAGGEDEESTEIVFTNTQINTDINAKDLAIDMPADAKVVYPLGPIERETEREGE